MGLLKYDKILTKQFLEEELISGKNTYKELTKKVGCNMVTISRYLTKFGLIKGVKKYTYIGEKIFNWTVISKSSKRRKYLCRCVCGTERDICVTYLRRSKDFKDCGCITKKTGSNSHLWKGCGEISGKIFSNIITGARLRDLVFDITIEEIWELFLKQDRKCVLSGLPLYFPIDNVSEYTASLDRIDSSKGYTIDNVQWVHRKINYMKQDLSDKEFVEYCNYVTNYKIGKTNENRNVAKIDSSFS